MMSQRPAARRRFLALAVLPALPVLPLVSACNKVPRPRALRFATLSEVRHELDRLANLADLRSIASWTWPATLQHGAQSIAFAMSGFPVAKPAWFQRSVGTTAFQIFAWQGRMHHDLTEPIPGAPALSPHAHVLTALRDLSDTIDAFHRHTGSLHPHFAYGKLSKAEYELANAMHLANHLAEFDVHPMA